MDLLRSFAASALASTGISLPFTVNKGCEAVPISATWLFVEDCTHRQTGHSCSVLQSSASASSAQIAEAKALVTRARTLHHPSILRFVDAHVMDSAVYVVVEPCSILSLGGRQASTSSYDSDVFAIQSLVKALAFLEQSGSSPTRLSLTPSLCLGARDSQPSIDHGTAFVFRTPSGQMKALAPPLIVNDAESRSHASALNGNSSSQPDALAYTAYALAQLMLLLFTSSTNPAMISFQDTKPPPPSCKGRMSDSLYLAWKKLLHPVNVHRWTIQHFLANGLDGNTPSTASNPTGFFARENELVRTTLELESFPLSNSEEARSQMVRRWSQKVQNHNNDWPPSFLLHVLQPSLLNFLTLNLSPHMILPLCLAVAQGHSTVSAKLAEHIVKLFASTDRVLRLTLLSHLAELLKLLSSSQIGTIWTPFTQGFLDTLPQMRQASLKALVDFAPLISDSLRNNDLLRHLAKLQLDEEPSIRANTAILLVKLSPQLSPMTRRKVLLPAFTRAARDTAVHSREAAMMGLIATEASYDREDVASKVLPLFCLAMIDKESSVRRQAEKGLDLFLKKLKVMIQDMPSSATQEQSSVPLGPTEPSPGSMTATDSRAPSPSWQIFGDMGAKLGTAAMTFASEQAASRPSSTPLPDAAFVSSQRASHDRTDHRAAVPASKLGALKLGDRSKRSLTTTQQAVQHALSEVSHDHDLVVGDEWGEDLMDLQDDSNDWGRLQSPEPTTTSSSSHRKELQPPILPNNSYMRPIEPTRSYSSPSNYQPKPLNNKNPTGPATEVDLVQRREERRMKLEQLKAAKGMR